MTASTALDLSTRYETRDDEKARVIGKILVAAGFEVRLFTFQVVGKDVDGNEVESGPDPRRPGTVLRTNASYSDLKDARTSYRQVRETVTASAVADMLGI